MVHVSHCYGLIITVVRDYYGRVLKAVVDRFWGLFDHC